MSSVSVAREHKELPHRTLEKAFSGIIVCSQEKIKSVADYRRHKEELVNRQRELRKLESKMAHSEKDCNIALPEYEKLQREIGEIEMLLS